MAGFISEWWPASNRNPGRLQIGIPGRLASEFLRFQIGPRRKRGRVTRADRFETGLNEAAGSLAAAYGRSTCGRWPPGRQMARSVEHYASLGHARNDACIPICRGGCSRLRFCAGADRGDGAARQTADGRMSDASFGRRTKIGDDFGGLRRIASFWRRAGRLRARPDGDVDHAAAAAGTDVEAPP